jgi:2-amino-4-hydroxy-6-hydroxymethyldihydropteridine diphosphokinase
MQRSSQPLTADAPLDPDHFRTGRFSARGFEQVFVHEGLGGSPLLLVHGWPETRRIWWRNLAPLARAGFEVIAPDLRGFGDSGLAPDGCYDTPSHSRDLHALVRGLGHERVTVVAGDAGGAVAQDLSLRFPGFVERMVLFNCPLPYLREEMAGLRTRPPAEAGDYFLRQGRDADALAAELASAEQRRRYVESFYTSRFWAHPGAFDARALAFMSEPFADPAKLRAGFGIYESVFHESARCAAPLLRRNPTPTLILFGPSDHVIFPDFDEMAARVFPDHVGPLCLAEVGHFLQWEAAAALNGAIRHLCRPRPPLAGKATRAFVSLGSNLGEREVALCGALAALRATSGVSDVVASPVYETDPVGPGEQGPYLNAAARLDTTLAPEALLARLLEIERAFGRTRSGVRNEARALDLDLLLYGELRVDGPALELPHPRMLERPFVLEPLQQLAPELRHPATGESLAAHAARVRDPAAVRRREPD